MRLSISIILICSSIFYGAKTIENYSSTNISSLPMIDSAAGIYFFTATHCIRCHGSDPQQRVLLTESGEDVNPVDDWAGSIMANSTFDPFWRAKVKEEIHLHNDKTKVIERTCLNCHAPMAMYQRLYTKGDTMSFNDIFIDTLAQDGVSCIACHGLENKDLFQIPGGELYYNQDSIIYGPYVNPYGVTMQQYSGLEPVHSSHIQSSGICAKCHTLITPIPGSDMGFVEQSIYQEWLNSSYSIEKIRCQDCHMPTSESPVVIASGVNGLDPRVPYAEHRLAGGNLFMLRLLRNNLSSLGLKSTYRQLDSAMAYNMQMLKHQSLKIRLLPVESMDDSLVFDVQLTNLSGHKLPSGYPSRRVFIQFIAINFLTKDTIFQSGSVDSKGHLIYRDSDFQPHYQEIANPSATQIYEMIPGDQFGFPTTILTAATTQLKDNRLVPRGWHTNHFTRDTTTIVGNANQDEDFNHDDQGTEGSGTDIIRYKFSPPNEGNLKIVVRAWYQAIPQRWVNEITPSDTLISQFQTMYHQESTTIELLATDSISNFKLPTRFISNIQKPIVYPNFLHGGSLIYIGNMNVDITSLKLFSPQGQLILQKNFMKDKSLFIPFLPPGMYFIQITSEKEIYTYPINLHQ